MATVRVVGVRVATALEANLGYTGPFRGPIACRFRTHFRLNSSMDNGLFLMGIERSK